MHLHPRPPQATLIISLLDLGLKIWSKSPDVLFDQIYVVSKIFRIIQFRSEKKNSLQQPKKFYFLHYSNKGRKFKQIITWYILPICTLKRYGSDPQHCCWCNVPTTTRLRTSFCMPRSELNLLVASIFSFLIIT